MTELLGDAWEMTPGGAERPRQGDEPAPIAQLSQAALQDYVDCPRRFELRYIRRLAWPAVDAEPVTEHETHVRQGEAFHRLIHQHQMGLPADRLTALAEAIAESGDGGKLVAWWQTYFASPFSAGPEGSKTAGPGERALAFPAPRYSEIGLSAPLDRYRLVAKYDLIAIDPGRRAVIVDWKTTEVRPGRPWLASRLQTRVYRYLIVRAGDHLNGGTPIRAEDVEMIYWFASDPSRPERFPYSQREFEADGGYLAALAGEIAGLPANLPLAEDTRRCRFCAYRSLCNRGIRAGDFTEGEADEGTGAPEGEAAGWEAGFDFEQVAEIAF